jgi:hypothetical protein
MADGAICSDRGCSIAIHPPTEIEWRALIEHRSDPVWHVWVDSLFCDANGMIDPGVIEAISIRARTIHDMAKVFHTPRIPVLAGFPSR